MNIFTGNTAVKAGVDMMIGYKIAKLVKAKYQEPRSITIERIPWLPPSHKHDVAHTLITKVQLANGDEELLLCYQYSAEESRRGNSAAVITFIDPGNPQHQIIIKQLPECFLKVLQ